MPEGYDEYLREREPDSDYTGEMHTIYGDGRPGNSASDFDEASADIPIWGWLSGASGRRDAQRAANQQRDAEAAWQNLLRFDTPSAAELTPETFLEAGSDQFGGLEGGPSQLEGFGPSGDQQTALAALKRLYESGGWTDRDTQIAGELRRGSAMERGQQLRGANEAAMQQMQARGMGGGSAELAERLSGSQALSQGQAIGDAQTNAAMHQAAMQRALGALQGYQSGSNTMQDQELARRNALDAYNQGNLDWRRGRETRNTAWANRGEEARANAVQTNYQNRERGVAGLTGQYDSNQGNSRADALRRDEQDKAGAGLIGDILSLAL